MCENYKCFSTYRIISIFLRWLSFIGLIKYLLHIHNCVHTPATYGHNQFHFIVLILSVHRIKISFQFRCCGGSHCRQEKSFYIKTAIIKINKAINNTSWLQSKTIHKASDSNGTLGLHYDGGVCLRRYIDSRKFRLQCSSLLFLKRLNLANDIWKSGVYFSIIAVHQPRKVAQRDGIGWGGDEEIEVCIFVLQLGCLNIWCVQFR